MKLQPGDVDLVTVFRRTLAVTGPERLLFGTDSSFFPRGWHQAIFDTQAQAMHAAGLSRDAAQAILAGNFQRIFT
jgi:predicted TIM-barrel fold metal-dependent hydrolase